MSPLRRRLNIIAGLLILGGLAWVYTPFLSGASDMRNFCDSLSPGMLIGELQAAARQRDYTVTQTGDGALIHAGSTFGRFICSAEFHAGKLVSSRYVNND